MKNESKRRSLAAKSAAPATTEILLECPKNLSPKAREEWDRLLVELPQVVRLKNLDRSMLSLYCEAYALWCDAIEGIQKYGSVMKSPSDYPVQSPYVAIANQQAATMERLSADFGLTPGSRSKLPRIRVDDPTSMELAPLVFP